MSPSSQNQQFLGRLAERTSNPPRVRPAAEIAVFQNESFLLKAIKIIVCVDFYQVYLFYHRLWTLDAADAVLTCCGLDVSISDINEVICCLLDCGK